MKKTTLYLPSDLKSSLERLSAAEGRSEADLVREAVRIAVAKAKVPKPRLPITDRPLGDRDAARRVDSLLEGFGRR